MTWVAPGPYAARFSLPLCYQILAIIQRDQASALAYFGSLDPPALTLDLIQDFVFSPRKLNQFPALRITPIQEVFDENAVGSLHYPARLLVSIGVVNQDADLTGVLLLKYVQALNSILQQYGGTSSFLTDFYTAMTVTLPWISGGAATTIPLAAGSVKDVFVASNNYSEIGSRGNQFHMSGTIELVIQMEDIQN
jgi:hypothetical protein